MRFDSGLQSAAAARLPQGCKEAHGSRHHTGEATQWLLRHAARGGISFVVSCACLWLLPWYPCDCDSCSLRWTWSLCGRTRCCTTTTRRTWCTFARPLICILCCPAADVTFPQASSGASRQGRALARSSYRGPAGQSDGRINALEGFYGKRVKQLAEAEATWTRASTACILLQRHWMRLQCKEGYEMKGGAKRKTWCACESEWPT